LRENQQIAKHIETTKGMCDADDSKPQSGPVENNREEKLDHETFGDAHLRHEDEGAGDDAMDDDIDQQYDMFMGCVSTAKTDAGSDEDDECRRMAADLGQVTREVIHLAMRFGVQPRRYAAQLQKRVKEMSEDSETSDDDVLENCGDDCVTSSLATEELFFMSENKPGEVCEVRQQPTVAEIYSPRELPHSCQETASAQVLRWT
jgi:hypothetical protein